MIDPAGNARSLMSDLPLIDATIGKGGTRTEIMDRVVALLQERVDSYTWVGVYLMDGDELVLGPFRGKPSPHTRIPLGSGICGAAATQKETVIVADVNADPRYLACSIETRSEIVVPIMDGTTCLGEIDIDSDQADVFGSADQEFLEAVAARLAPVLRPA
ncbi:MAG TPA: GAF domain-containing protein [Acidobacteriota bacterium]|nr:GAF domain-containing protein [Acidobacteriota bacterium]